MHRWCAIVLILLGPSLAWAEQLGSSGTRATGFMLDVEIGVSTPSVVSIGGLGGFVTNWGVTPRLIIGGQIRRLGIGLLFGVALNDTVYDEDDPDDPPSWTMTMGPAVDYEVWSRSAAGLVLSFAMPVNFTSPDEDSSGIGFGLDAAIGGRYWFDRFLAIGVKAGTLVSFTFWEQDRDPVDAEWTSISWTIYGAIELRFVAGS